MTSSELRHAANAKKARTKMEKEMKSLELRHLADMKKEMKSLELQHLADMKLHTFPYLSSSFI